MKQFIRNNWYQLLKGISMFIIACSLLVFAAKSNTAHAGSSPGGTSESVWVVAKGNSFYEVSYNGALKQYNCKKICE